MIPTIKQTASEILSSMNKEVNRFAQTTQSLLTLLEPSKPILREEAMRYFDK